MGWRSERIVAELTRIRSQAGMLLTVDRYDNLLRSGRISRGKAWLAGMLDVKPVLSFDTDGHVVPIERVRGRENLEARVRRYQPQDCFVSLATGVLGTHVGPGAWGIFYQVEDGLTTPVGQGGPPHE